MQTILVVEDSRFLRAANEKVLTRAGYKVLTAGDGQEALRVAGETSPDLILLDMLLPKLSGPEVLRSLRTIPQTVSIPIVVLSSLPQSNESKLKRDGATAYFDKSSLGLDKGSNALVDIVKSMLDAAQEANDEDLAPYVASRCVRKGEA